MKIVLLGYMASGKSIIAKMLSEKIDLKYIDLDLYIEKKEGKIISKIFKTNGEIYFRLLENACLLELLLSNENFILSVGGGTPCYANNMELINKHAQSIFLKASINTIYTRIIVEKEKRPLIAAIENNRLKEFIAKHLFERNIFYELANYHLKVDDLSVDEIIENIVIQLDDKIN